MIINKKFAIAIILIITLSFFLTACVPKTQGSLSNDEANDEPSAISYSMITIDINPSIQFTVQNGIVSEVKAFNDDGTEILEDYPVEGLMVKEAMNIIITSFVNENYITYDEKATILVTITGSSDEDLAETIKKATEEVLEEKDLEVELIMANVDEEASNEAVSSGYSAGRYMLLNYIAQQEGITFQETAAAYGDMNINELLSLFEDAEDYFEDQFKDLDEEDEEDEEDYDDDDENDDDEDYTSDDDEDDDDDENYSSDDENDDNKEDDTSDEDDDDTGDDDDEDDEDDAGDDDDDDASDDDDEDDEDD